MQYESGIYFRKAAYLDITLKRKGQSHRNCPLLFYAASVLLYFSTSSFLVT